MGRPDQAIFLIKVYVTEDEIGNQVETSIVFAAFPAMGLGVCPDVSLSTIERMVFAEELAVFSSEFYNAALTGLRPEKKFEVYTCEYQGETKLKHDGITYHIIRTELGKVKKKIRLICERAAVDG